MATPKQPAPHDDAGARPEGPWREDEKRRGAESPGQGSGGAGDTASKGRSTDDRARTEGAVADVVRRGGSDGMMDRPPPDPNTVVVRGIGAGAPDPKDPAAPHTPR